MTVLGLLIVLLALEAVRNQNVLAFLKTWLGNFRQGLNATTQPQSNTSSGSQQSTSVSSSTPAIVPLSNSTKKGVLPV